MQRSIRVRLVGKFTEEDDGNNTVPVEQAIQDGHVAVWLEGRKPVKSQPESVVSGRTIEDIAAEAEAGEDSQVEPSGPSSGSSTTRP